MFNLLFVYFTTMTYYFVTSQIFIEWKIGNTNYTVSEIKFITKNIDIGLYFVTECNV